MTPLQRKFHKLIRAAGVFDEAYYARLNPAAAAMGLDPLEHYITIGEAEDRAPSPFFDPGWYRQQLKRVPEGHCLLAHYLTVGDAEGLQPMVGLDPAFVREQLGGGPAPALVGFQRAHRTGKPLNPNRFFDYGWYLANNPDVAAVRGDAYAHFLRLGADEGRLPSEGFSWDDLRERYHLAGGNAEMFRALMLRWRHLNADRAAELVSAAQAMQDEIRAWHRPGPDYQPHADPPEGSRRDCDVYAFYLTQFHQVAENDAWWGDGFTEWHNVARGVPRFAGHYQPRIPSALGFYDLEDPRIMPRQVALAKQAGLAGFAFYYYHFGSQRLLERPLERFLADPALDTGFFLIWANETWSRRWDGSEAEILIEQEYPADMPEVLAADFARHFADPRYRRIDGRPLLVIYRARALPDAKRWIASLRKGMRALGEDPLVYLAQTFEDLDPVAFGCDGALEFPPHKLGRGLPRLQPARGYGANPQLKIWHYDQFVQASRAQSDPPYPLIRTCFPSWDNDARRQGASSVIHGSTPEKFRGWLEALVGDAERAPPGQRIVCINAWNEWGEGAYLEPDRHFGYAYLNTVQEVLHAEPGAARRKLLLVGHDAFPSGAQRLLLNLGRTLREEGVYVAFLLLRADAGYDALLEEYRAVAPTSVARGDPAALVARLAGQGFDRAIVNSAASAPALPALAEAGVRTILLIHELSEMLEKLGTAPLLAAHAGSVHRFVAPTRAIAAMLEGLGIRSVVRPQGQYRRIERMDRADARAAMGVRPEARLVVGMGYGDARKGVDLFVATAEAAADVDFLWQGDWDPALRETLRQRIEALGGRFRHLPTGGDVETAFSAADAFFLPSREDPLPSVAIEAWSCGLPVVAVAGTGGIADLIAEQPMLGSLSATLEPRDLLAEVEAALAQGRSDARADWAATRFDWPAYTRALLDMLDPTASIDVAIIGHNHGRFAEPRIVSVTAQTLAPRAIRYIDIASTDVGAAEASARHGIPHIAAPANHGRLYESWAEAVAASDAEYFHIAEGDDWIAPTMLERCVEALEASPRAAYAFTGVDWIDAEDQHVASHLDYPASVIGNAATRGEIRAETLLASGMMVRNPVLTMSSVVWRREILADLLRANATDLGKLSFAFDWLLYIRAAAAGHSAVFVPEALCRHRQHAASFAARDQTARHAAEIARIHALNPAPFADRARAQYLSELA